MTEKSLAMRVRTRYSTKDEFITALGQYFDHEGMFVRTPQKKAPGALVRFEFQLSDGQIAFCGEGLVSQPAVPLSESDGLYLRLTRLDPPSKALFAQIVSQKPSQELPPSEEPPGSIEPATSSWPPSPRAMAGSGENASQPAGQLESTPPAEPEARPEPVSLPEPEAGRQPDSPPEPVSLPEPEVPLEPAPQADQESRPFIPSPGEGSAPPASLAVQSFPLAPAEIDQEWALTSADLELIADSIDMSLDSVLLSKGSEVPLPEALSSPQAPRPMLQVQGIERLPRPEEHVPAAILKAAEAPVMALPIEEAPAEILPAQEAPTEILPAQEAPAGIAGVEESEGISDDFEIVAADTESDLPQETDLPEIRTGRFVQEDAEQPIISDLIADLITDAGPRRQGLAPASAGGRPSASTIPQPSAAVPSGGQAISPDAMAARTRPVASTERSVIEDDLGETPPPQTTEPDMAELLARQEPPELPSGKPRGFFKRLFGRKS